MAKMKLAPTLVFGQTLVQLTGKLQSHASVTSISFLNATHSNFLNVFFMRPAKGLRLKFFNLFFYKILLVMILQIPLY